MNDEEFTKLMEILKTLKDDVRSLQSHEVLTRAAFLVLKDLAIAGLARDRDLPAEKAEKVFHDSLAKKHEELILRIGDYHPEFARSIDLHKNREDDWLS